MKTFRNPDFFHQWSCHFLRPWNPPLDHLSLDGMMSMADCPGDLVAQPGGGAYTFHYIPLAKWKQGLSNICPPVGPYCLPENVSRSQTPLVLSILGLESGLLGINNEMGMFVFSTPGSS